MYISWTCLKKEYLQNHISNKYSKYIKEFHLIKNLFLIQKVSLTSLDLDLYGNGVDCTDEYVEVLDGDTVDALSLGK